MLKYKGEIVVIKVIVSEKSYIFSVSFLLLDYIFKYGEENGKKYEFSGYRGWRGLCLELGLKIRINVDVNGLYNIMRKVILIVFDGGIEGVVVCLVRIIFN